jgi:hypothetical protein
MEPDLVARMDRWRMFAGLRHLGVVRSDLGSLHAAVETTVVTRHGLVAAVRELLGAPTVDVTGPDLTLPPHAAWWLSAGRSAP